MNLWTALLDVLLLLLGAMLLGTIFERLKQSPILGYLLAGTLLGPQALDIIPNHEAIASIAELGVALLLFVIGLEFSLKRLRGIGAIAYGGGTLQILVTVTVSTGAARMFGMDPRTAFAIGATIALSSTAVVIRLLADRTEIDSIHGRNALGILLLQDIAVVPLVLIVTALGGEGSAAEIGWDMTRALGLAVVFVGTLLVVLKYILPKLLQIEKRGTNPDVGVLLAMVTAVGCAWGSHALGLSPVLGAFVGGVALAESPFSTQIRADVAPLKTLFVTLFFASIGMLANPAWVAANWALVVTVAATVIVGKMVVVSLVALLFRFPLGHSVATGLCLAQIGEFSFVIAGVAHGGRLFGDDLFELIVAVTVLTIFSTPFLVALAPRLVVMLGGVQARGPVEKRPDGDARLSDHIVILGFGPAGKKAAEELREKHFRLVVVDLNPDLVAGAQAMGIDAIIGDATRLETLEHVGVDSARAIAVTVPDPGTAVQITAQLHRVAPQTPIIARSRYHRYVFDLTRAGAGTIVDEETEVGFRIAVELETTLKRGS